MPALFQPSVVSYQSSARKAKSRKPARPAGGLKTEGYKKGFTLIELMIAISIVAIISTVGLISYSQAQKLGRDAKRKQDLRSIAIALELYYQKNGQYPAPDPAYRRSNSGLTPWIQGGSPTTSLDSTYITSLPIDPINTPSCTINSATNCYTYHYLAQDWSSWGAPICPSGATSSYILIAQLENTDDPDINSKKNYKWCGVAETWTWGGQWSKAFIITPH